MALVGFAFAGLLVVAGVIGARWLVSRAFGIRGTFRDRVDTGAERGNPLLAYARAFASIAAIYLGCVLLFALGFASGGRTVIDEKSMRVTVMDGPAYRAGMETGDRIVTVDGEKIEDWDQLRKIVRTHDGETILVEAERGAERKTFRVLVVEAKIRVGPFVQKDSLSAGEVLGESFAAPISVTRAMIKGFLVAPKPSELSGPVGITKEVDKAGETGPGTFFKLLAALATYQGVVIGFVLLGVAFFTAFVGKRTLPTSGNSS